MKWILRLLWLASLTLSMSARGDFLAEFPGLTQFVHREPRSQFYFGFGVSPVGIVDNRIIHSFSAFQCHYIDGLLDFEMFNATIALSSVSKEGFSSSRQLAFRSSPKLLLFGFLSVGPLLGYEYVSFPDVTSRLVKGSFATPYEPFSGQGLVYGAVVSQSFDFGDAYKIKLTQSLYRQTYDTHQTGTGWTHQFERRELEMDPDRTLIKPSLVFQLEVAFLF